MPYQGAATARKSSTSGIHGVVRSCCKKLPFNAQNTSITKPGSNRPTGPLASTATPQNAARAM